MTSGRLALVPVDDVPCFWCGIRSGHDSRCVVGQSVALLKPRPTSREEFAAAQRAGDTVGHEWARSQGK